MNAPYLNVAQSLFFSKFYLEVVYGKLRWLGVTNQIGPPDLKYDFVIVVWLKSNWNLGSSIVFQLIDNYEKMII